jgi:cell division protein FtsN
MTRPAALRFNPVRTLCVTTVLATVILPVAAFSAPTTSFMLQFGSFESRGEAEQRLNTLTGKHNGLIGGMPSRVLEVALQDNLHVYRTQAGPVVNRAEAQSICAQLASNGDECYVVETAMRDSSKAKLSATDTAKLTLTADEPKIVVPTLESVMAPAEKATVTPALVMPDLPDPSGTAATVAPALNETPASERDAAARALGEDMRAVKSLEHASSPSSLTVAGASMSSQLAAPNAEDSPAPVPKPSSSFWDIINPFAENYEEKPLPKSGPEHQAVVEAQPISSEKEDSGVMPESLSAPLPTQETNASLAASLPPLPPPPVMKNNVAEQTSQEFSVQQLPPPPPTTVMPSVTAGNVTVEEAQRVPLSADVLPPPPPPPPPETSAQLTLASPEVTLPASQPMNKTLWVQLGTFPDAPSALAFWDGFRNTHPDFPVVRVRVIQSYGQRVRGDSKVSLRVGPFARQESIAYLCDQQKENRKLTCARIVEMGMSSSMIDGRIRALQGEANLATHTLMAQNAPQMQGTYWLQLGSYPSLPQAQNAWEQTKQRYGAAMVGMNPNITVPPLSSGSQVVYRLRSGPFTSELAANKACLTLKSAGGNCIVATQ